MLGAVPALGDRPAVTRLPRIGEAWPSPPKWHATPAVPPPSSTSGTATTPQRSAPLVDEAELEYETLLDVVCGLLYVGSNLAKAAADGEYSNYLEQLRAASMLAELETEESTHA